MHYKLTAVDEADPRWTQQMENWWSQGGALLWNRFGGFGSDSLVLTEEELARFLSSAGTIEGWSRSPHAGSQAGNGAAFDNPIIVESYHGETPTNSVEPQTQDSSAMRPCCRDCGRPVHPSLRSRGNSDLVPVPRRQLNHVLHTLEEAVSYGRGEGPNNYRTWEAVLDELVAVISSKE